jgi:hypothetical protein
VRIATEKNHCYTSAKVLAFSLLRFSCARSVLA